MKTPKGGLSVMQQRRSFKEGLDFFPTPPWATRALCEWIAEEQGASHVKTNLLAWEPAAGRHHMARAMDEYFAAVYRSDVAEYPGVKHDIVNFLSPLEARIADAERPDWIITNPPYLVADDFAHLAIERAAYGVALLVRTAFLEGGARYKRLFDPTPPTDILQFVERVPMHKDVCRSSGSTATAYCWVVWRKKRIKQAAPHFRWIPPCRKRLEKKGDYDDE